MELVHNSRSATISPFRKMVTALGLFFMCDDNNNLKRKMKNCHFWHHFEYTGMWRITLELLLIL